MAQEAPGEGATPAAELPTLSPDDVVVDMSDDTPLAPVPTAAASTAPDTPAPTSTAAATATAASPDTAETPPGALDGSKKGSGVSPAASEGPSAEIKFVARKPRRGLNSAPQPTTSTSTSEKGRSAQLAAAAETSPSVHAQQQDDPRLRELRRVAPDHPTTRVVPLARIMHWPFGSFELEQRVNLERQRRRLLDDSAAPPQTHQVQLTVYLPYQLLNDAGLQALRFTLACLGTEDAPGLDVRTLAEGFVYVLMLRMRGHYESVKASLERVISDPDTSDSDLAHLLGRLSHFSCELGATEGAESHAAECASFASDIRHRIAGAMESFSLDALATLARHELIQLFQHPNVAASPARRCDLVMLVLRSCEASLAAADSAAGSGTLAVHHQHSEGDTDGGGEPSGCGAGAGDDVDGSGSCSKDPPVASASTAAGAAAARSAASPLEPAPTAVDHRAGSAAVLASEAFESITALLARSTPGEPEGPSTTAASDSDIVIHVNKLDAAELLHWAIRYRAGPLARACLDELVRHPGALPDASFVRLPPSIAVHLLSRTDLRVANEDVVYAKVRVYTEAHGGTLTAAWHHRLWGAVRYPFLGHATYLDVAENSDVPSEFKYLALFTRDSRVTREQLRDSAGAVAAAAGEEQKWPAPAMRLGSLSSRLPGAPPDEVAKRLRRTIRVRQSEHESEAAAQRAGAAGAKQCEGSAAREEWERELLGRAKATIDTKLRDAVAELRQSVARSHAVHDRRLSKVEALSLVSDCEVIGTDLELAVDTRAILSGTPFGGEHAWELLFRASRDGTKAATLEKHCKGEGAKVVLVRTTEDRVFGAFVSQVESDVFLFALRGMEKGGTPCRLLQQTRAPGHGLLRGGDKSSGNRFIRCWYKVENGETRHYVAKDLVILGRGGGVAGYVPAVAARLGACARFVVPEGRGGLHFLNGGNRNFRIKEVEAFGCRKWVPE